MILKAVFLHNFFLSFVLYTIFLSATTPSTVLAEKKYLSSYAHRKYIEERTCEAPQKLSKQKIRLKKILYGKSKKGRALIAYIVPPKSTNEDKIKNVFILASQHGDEKNASRVLDLFVRELRTLPASYRNNRRILIIPLYNPDGYHNNDRFAAGKIDLNRDFPSSNGAEGAPHAPETKAFMRLLEKYPANFIYNMHQPFRVVLHYPEDLELAKPFAIMSDYPLSSSVGYPTPGSLGTWAREKKIPTITVELSRSMRKVMTPFIYEEVRLALFHSAFGCIPQKAIASRIEKYLQE
ncbi:MAG: hypothetical protein LDLANPLL_02402 [Turneriella sp.]|nr:hypothetical protein [Turneriella sp.]